MSDKVYLSGDTRLSYLDGDEYKVRHDNMQKVEYLAGQGVNQSLIAAAGDAAFARDIIKALRAEPFARQGIAIIREQIEEWIRPIVDDYFTKNGYTSGSFILTGADTGSTKMIDGFSWKVAANAYTGGKGAIMLNKPLLDVIKPGNPVPDGDINLDINDTKLFGIGISQQTGVIVTDTKWGEVLLYGQNASVVKEDITPKEVGKLEMGIYGNGTGSSQDGQAMALIDAIVLSLASKHNLETVGGAVFTMNHSYTGETFIVTGLGQMYSLEKLRNLKPGEGLKPEATSEIHIENNKFYRVEHGTKYRLKPISEYRSSNSSKLYL